MWTEADASRADGQRHGHRTGPRHRIGGEFLAHPPDGATAFGQRKSRCAILPRTGSGFFIIAVFLCFRKHASPPFNTAVNPVKGGQRCAKRMDNPRQIQA